MIAVVVVAAIAFALFFKGANGESLLGEIGDQLGIGPPNGGADGSPQAQNAANYSQTGPVGNSEQNTAHQLESAFGAAAGAGVCTYYGAAAAAPLCAKIGAYVGPKAVQLGNFTTLKTVDYSTKLTTAGLNIGQKSVNIGTNIANKGASVADRAYAGAGKLPGPVGTVAKAAVLPVKVAADLGAKGAQVGGEVAGAITGGAKKAANAVDNTVHKILGFL